jgi:DHA2 family lincomycin resistance protein-like MFS transporter
MSTELSSNAPGDPAQATGAQASAQAAPATPAKMSRESVTIIATLLVATFVVILNETIMNVALQRLMVDLRIDAPTVQWLSTGFMLTMAVVIPTTGFILQSLSTRAVFMLAMGLFAGGTALAAAAPGFEILLLARIVQAGGTAIMLPLLMTTILTLVPVARRGAVMGNVSIAISVAPAMGPTVSGLILEHFSWRFMFVFVLPVALAALALGAKYLTNVGETEKTKLDFLSVFLTIPAFGGVVYGLSQIGGGQGGQGGPGTAAIGALVIGVASLAVFVLRQLRLQRAEAPLLDLRAFNFRMFTVSVLLMVVAMMALFGGVILLPLYLQEIRGLGSLETGLALLPGGLAMGLLGPVIGRIFDKVGPLPLTVTGSILMVLSLWQFSMLDAGTAVWWIVTLHVGLSFGLALLFTPAFTTGLNPLPPHLYSHGSAIMSTTQQVAGAAGTALLVSIFAVVSAASGLVAGMNAAFLTATVIALAAVVLSAMMRKTEGAAPGHGAGH